MSSLFPILSIASSGANAAETWMAATSDNLANLNTVNPAGQQPFRAEEVVTSADPAGGVQVDGVVRNNATPDRVYEPDNPMADAKGYITRPVVDETLEMTNLIAAQRLYGLNLAVHRTAMDTYKQALSIGQ